MPNYYRTSTGEKLSQATIDRRRSATYRELYEGEPAPMCHGCGKPAQASAHILPQARAKQLGLSELCYSRENIFPACNSCNAKAENISSPEILTLMNYETIKTILEKYDPERAAKLPE